MERDERTSSLGPAGVMAMAGRQRRPDATREAPAVIAVTIKRQLARDRPGPETGLLVPSDYVSHRTPLARAKNPL